MLIAAGGASLAGERCAIAQSIITAAPAPALRSTLDDPPAAPRRSAPTTILPSTAADATADPGVDGAGGATRARDRVSKSVRSAKIHGATARELRPNRAAAGAPRTTASAPGAAGGVPAQGGRGAGPPAAGAGQAGATAGPASAGGSSDASRSTATLQTPAPGLADSAKPTARKRRTEVDFYEPLGVRVGNMNVFVAGESGVGFDDNTERSSTLKRPSVLFREGAEVKLRSDWSEHELRADVRGGYTWYPRAPEADRP